MIKVSKTTGPVSQPQLRTGRVQDGTFAELLAEQTARSRQDQDSTDQKPDDSTDTDVENSLEPIRAEESDAREELIKLLSMSSAERIRYIMLQQMGLTEESLAQLPYDERQRIEQLIEQEIKRQLGSHYDQTQPLRES